MCAKPDLPAWAGPKAGQAEWAGYVLQVLTAAAYSKKEALKQTPLDFKISWVDNKKLTMNWTSTAQSLC